MAHRADGPSVDYLTLITHKKIKTRCDYALTIYRPIDFANAFIAASLSQKTAFSSERGRRVDVRRRSSASLVSDMTQYGPSSVMCIWTTIQSVSVMTAALHHINGHILTKQNGTSLTMTVELLLRWTRTSTRLISVH